ncbi:MAG TPA: type II secretion system minor pseudopilin GspK [Candidatus Competibacteraceae bacterium]|nr:type II secretion system minor pseudopilin GspK [Candidatus Competibacteraceae bacterium]HRZ04935.1 type II secretion system minor pseudopilin GspK [Candidatus Competibacteraceae bacterium]HSA45353.1 type II secretion system minor pseudopilin GspK [Candidatus Competibacteraceae bacterium]
MRLPACFRCPANAPTPPPRCGRGLGGGASGVALITVLLIVFLASLTAISLATVQQIAIRRSTVLQHQQQARLYTLGIEQWAGLILMRDRQDNATDHPGETWANLPPVLPVDNGGFSGKIRDLQGCFNLNNLWRPAPGDSSTRPDEPQDSPKTDKNAENPAQPSPVPQPPNPTDPASPKLGKAEINQEQLKVLQRLLAGLELKPELAQAITDWLDPDPDPLFPDGAEDSDYTVLNPPYLAANQPFASLSELRLVKGVDREIYAKLAPLVCALPPGTPLNVNTAPALVLAALDEKVELADLKRLLEDRPAKGYEHVDEFLNAAKMTPDAPTKALLSVDSQYFLLQAEARVGDGRAMLYSTIFRDENGVRVLRRSFGNQD